MQRVLGLGLEGLGLGVGCKTKLSTTRMDQWEVFKTIHVESSTNGIRHSLAVLGGSRIWVSSKPRVCGTLISNLMPRLQTRYLTVVCPRLMSRVCWDSPGLCRD